MLVHGDDELLYLGVVSRVRPAGADSGAVEELWIETNVPGCPGRDSDEFGWVRVEDVAARIVMEWPW